MGTPFRSVYTQKQFVGYLAGNGTFCKTYVCSFNEIAVYAAVGVTLNTIM